MPGRHQKRTTTMIRTCIAQAAAVATLGLGGIALLPSAAITAAVAPTAATAQMNTTPFARTVSDPTDLTWG